MKKNVWIFNHYATNTYFDEGGRHYWIGKELTKKGYQVTIFCANTVHKSDKFIAIPEKNISVVKKKAGLTFVFVKTNDYQGNGKARVKNMLLYTLNLLRVYRRFGKDYGKPDVVYASSVHPLALYAGVRVAKHYHVKSVCEIRDMWPLTLIEFGKIRRESFIAKLMLLYEKKMYEWADELIFTMEGGRKYVQSMRWDLEQNGKIDIGKIHYINNGVNVKDFLEYRERFRVEDADLKNQGFFNISYTGTIGRANRIDLIIEAAKFLQKKELPIKILIWGDGDESRFLQEKIRTLELKNVVLKGKVEKKYIPYIVSTSNMNIFVLENCALYQYGLSLNKMFEYMVAQKPFLVAGTKCECQILNDNPYCIICESSDPEKISLEMEQCYLEKDKYQNMIDTESIMEMCDFEKRAEDLIQVLER